MPQGDMAHWFKLIKVDIYIDGGGHRRKYVVPLVYTGGTGLQDFHWRHNNVAVPPRLHGLVHQSKKLPGA